MQLKAQWAAVAHPSNMNMDEPARPRGAKPQGSGLFSGHRIGRTTVPSTPCDEADPGPTRQHCSRELFTFLGFQSYESSVSLIGDLPIMFLLISR